MTSIGMRADGCQSQLLVQDIAGPNRQEVSIWPLATEVVRQLAGMASARGAELRVDPVVPKLVTDVGQLEFVRMNLVSNGIKYNERDEDLGVEGFGRGVNIVEESVRVLGGHMRVESVEGEGRLLSTCPMPAPHQRHA